MRPAYHSKLSIRLDFPGLTMARLLSIVLLASLIAGFASPGTPEARGATMQAVVSGEPGSSSGGSMAAMECGACAGMGACIASGPRQSAGPAISQLPPRQSSLRSSNQVWAPDAAPPKPSSL